MELDVDLYKREKKSKQKRVNNQLDIKFSFAQNRWNVLTIKEKVYEWLMTYLSLRIYCYNIHASVEKLTREAYVNSCLLESKTIQLVWLCSVFKYHSFLLLVILLCELGVHFLPQLVQILKRFMFRWQNGGEKSSEVNEIIAHLDFVDLLIKSP